MIRSKGSRPFLVGLGLLVGTAVMPLGDRPAATAATAATLEATPEADPVTLELDLEPGEPWRQRMEVTQGMSQDSPGSVPVSIGSTIVLDVTHRVLADAPTKGRFVLQTTIDRVQARVVQPMLAATVMDSDRPASIIDNPAAAPFGLLFDAVGTPLRYELTEAGKFAADESVKAISIGRSGGAATPLRSFLRQMILPVPGRAVEVGGTWTQSVPAAEVGRDSDLELTWTLTATDAGTTGLGVAATTEVTDQPVSVGPGLEGRMSMTGTIVGKAIARADGWIQWLETEQKTEGTAEIPQGAGTMTTSFRTVVTTSIRTDPSDDAPLLTWPTPAAP